MLVVTDGKDLFIISGSGDVLEPEGNIAAVGSGGNFALAAAKAIYENDLSSEEICKKSLKIAADICVYTNHNIVIETIKEKEMTDLTPREIVSELDKFYYWAKFS